MVEWDVVDGRKQAERLYLPRHNNTIYQFAVSANAKEGVSSGMVWASCTLIHNKGMIDSLQEVKIDLSDINLARIDYDDGDTCIHCHFDYDYSAG
jgi:hypothetical protein